MDVKRGVQQPLFDRTEMPRRKEDALDIPWQKLRNYCRDQLQYGEILIQIQDGVPVCAEHIKKKIRLT